MFVIYRVTFLTGPAQKSSKYGTGPTQQQKMTKYTGPTQDTEDDWVFNNFEHYDSLSNNVKCQDGARIHTSNASLDFLQQAFGDRIMTGRRRGQMMDWPASSPDLSPADFWLHGYLKVSSNF